MSTPDVVVIGGGPAGSTTATLLADAGFKVTLLEKEQFPRPHVGESLLPATLAILERIGVLDAVAAAGFIEKPGATMAWGTNTAPWTWYFRETNQRFPHAYQVHRPKFDQILLDHSSARGVDVRQGVAVTAVDAGGVLLADGRIDAQMIVDASGQSSLLANRLQLKEWDTFFRNLAVYGYFSGAEHLPEPDAGNIFIESCPQGWLWKIPLSGDLTSVGAVVDRDVGAAAIREHGLAAFFDAQIGSAPRISAMLEHASLVDGPVAVRDWSYCATRLAADNYVLVGDAACFVDPLFSTGVHLAVSGAHLAAAYVHSALAIPGIKDEAAQQYERLYRTQYRHFHELAKLFYSANRTVDGYFWEARRLTGTQQYTPRQAFVRAVSGQAAAGYERSVLSHGALPSEFVDQLSSHESTRGTRARTFNDQLRPRLREGLELVRTAVLGENRFDWGYAVRGDERDDLPVSPLIAHIVHGADGTTTVADLAVIIAEANDLELSAVMDAAREASRLLYVDGVFD